MPALDWLRKIRARLAGIAPARGDDDRERLAAMTRPVWCVLPAAGTGRRVGGSVPKQYRPLLGKPMLIRTMERLAAHPRIAGFMVALSEHDTHWPGFVVVGGKPVRTCPGGKERADSVLSGLSALRDLIDDDDFVLVHDAARPCVPLADIEKLLRLGMVHEVGALLAAPLRDTIKRAAESQDVESSVPRDGLWRALTPQLFRLGDLAEALASALADPATARLITDESSALEFLKKRPLLVEGSEDNVKVTTEDDFARAEQILRMQGVA